MQIATIQKNILRVTLLTVMAGAVLSGCGSGGSPANENAQAILQQSAPSGMTGVFYSDTQFKNILTVATVESSIPSTNGAQALSLTGLYYVAKTGAYSFSTAAQGSTISIAGQLAFVNGTSAVIQLTAGQLYQVVLTQTSIDGVPSIDITDPSGKRSNFLPNQFYLPAHDYSANKITVQKATNGKASLQGTTSSNPCSNPSDPQLSCAGDGIPNDWKTNGFIAKLVNNVPQLYKANPTDPTQQGYPVYYANYAATNGKTTADYYTDYEKVMGLTPDNINRPVDPLVAIYPEVIVNVSNVDLQPVNSVSHSVTLSHTDTSQSSFQEAVAVEIAASLTISLTPSLVTGLKITNTNTWNWTNSSSNTGSWADTIGANTGNAANATANLNYVNIGNARASNFTPTLSLAIGPTQTAAYTGVATQQSTITPGEISPAIAWGSNGSIQLNQDQVNQWQDTGIFNIYVNQAASNPSDIKSGNPTVNSSINWSDLQPQIDNTSAHIILQIPGVLQDRSIFVYSSSETSVNPNLKLTLRQAFMRAFNATETNGVFTFTANNQQYTIAETSLNVVGNAAATAVAPTQTDLWNLPLQQNFAFHIAPADHVDFNGLRFYYDNSANPLQGFKTTTDSNGAERYFQNGLPVTGLVNISNFSGSTVNLGDGKTNNVIAANSSRTYCMYSGFSSIITKDSNSQSWYYCSGSDDPNGNYLSLNDVPGIVSATLSSDGSYQKGSGYNFYESSSSGILQTGEISVNGLWFYADPASMQIKSGDILTDTGAYYNYDGKGGRTVLSKDKVTINGVMLDQLTPSVESAMLTPDTGYKIEVQNNNPDLLGNLTSVTVSIKDESGNQVLAPQTNNSCTNSSSCSVAIPLSQIKTHIGAQKFIITVTDRIGSYLSDDRTLTTLNINFSIPTTASVTDLSPRSLFGSTANAMHVAFDLNGKSYSRVLLPGGQYSIDQSAGKIIMNNAADWEVDSAIDPFIASTASVLSGQVRISGTTGNGVDLQCPNSDNLRQMAASLITQGRDEVADKIMNEMNCSQENTYNINVTLPPTKLYIPFQANYDGYQNFTVWNSPNGYRADRYGNSTSNDSNNDHCPYVDTYNIISSTYDGGHFSTHNNGWWQSFCWNTNTLDLRGWK